MQFLRKFVIFGSKFWQFGMWMGPFFMKIGIFMGATSTFPAARPYPNQSWVPPHPHCVNLPSAAYLYKYAEFPPYPKSLLPWWFIRWTYLYHLLMKKNKRKSITIKLDDKSLKSMPARISTKMFAPTSVLPHQGDLNLKGNSIVAEVHFTNFEGQIFEVAQNA